MMKTSRSDLAAQIKARVPLEEAVRHYGFEPDRAGFLHCPFHQGDNSPSLKIYPDGRGWYCYGCQKHGTVIDFVMNLYNVDFRQALFRLDYDFQLGLTGVTPGPAQVQALEEIHQAQAERKRQREEYDRHWEHTIELTHVIDGFSDLVLDLCRKREEEDTWLAEHQSWSGQKVVNYGTGETI